MEPIEFFSINQTFYNMSLNGTNVTMAALAPKLTLNSIITVAVYCVLFVVAAAGNLSVIVALFRSKRHRRSRVSLMICHLAVADLVVAFFMIPLEVGWRLTIQWRAGNLACKAFLFLRAFGLYLSSNVLVCVSLDRYFAVLHPLRVSVARKRGKVMLGAAWGVALIYSVPQLVVVLFVGACAAGRLEHTYLPPSSAQSAGGEDEYQSAPNGGSNLYLPPQQDYQGHDQHSASDAESRVYLRSQEQYQGSNQQYTAAKPAARQYLPPQQQYSAPRTAARQYLPPQQQSQRSQYSAPRRSQYSAPRPTARQYLPPQQSYQSAQYSAPRPAARQYLPPQQQSYQNSQNYAASKSASRQYLPPSASAYSQGPATPPTPILKYENQPNAGDGAYNFELETGNGIMQNEHGHQEGQEEEVVEGSYSYTADDGAQYTVQYKADANGFQAYGDHLPTPPLIPEAIQRSLEINAAAEAARQAQGYQYNDPQGGSARSGNGGYQY